MKRRVIKWICICVAAVLTVFAAGTYFMFGAFIKAAFSIEKLENGLYMMEFDGDYGFDKFLEKGGAASDGELADYLVEYLSRGFYKADVQTGDFGCSAVCVRDGNGDVLFGRNYDWEKCSALIMHTRPANGYESFSTACLDFLGFGSGYTPDGSAMERFQTLAAVYVPLDGMNEKGLFVADLMAGDDEVTRQNRGKTKLTTTTAIRLLLDRAADVNEALSLLEMYDMNSSIGSAHHFAIADKSGRSVVVEYVNGEMLVTDTAVVTNHYLCDSEKTGTGSGQSHMRYDALAASEGVYDMNGVMKLLESVAQFNYAGTDGSYEKTMWSIAYCPGGLCADFCFAENYAHKYGVILLGKGAPFVKM